MRVLSSRKDLSRDEFIKTLGAHPLEFETGSRYSTATRGYNLLGFIIETVSGKSYWDFMRERIFKPLGMNQTADRDPKYIIKNRATGYEWRKQLARRARLRFDGRFQRGRNRFNRRGFGEMGRGLAQRYVAQKRKQNAGLDARYIERRKTLPVWFRLARGGISRSPTHQPQRSNRRFRREYFALC